MQYNKKCNLNLFFSITKLLIYIISFVFFILSFIFNNILFIIFSIPFNMIFLCFVHEMGHYIGCIIKNKKIKLIRIFSFKYEDKKLSIIPTYCFGGVCTFYKDDNSSKLVYALGPIFSLILFIIILVVYLVIRIKFLIVLLVMSFITLLFVSIPYRGSDIYNLIYYGGKPNGKES